MDLKFGGIVNILESNAMLLTIVGSAYTRFSEGGQNGLDGMIRHFTSFDPQGEGVLSEIFADLGMKGTNTNWMGTLKWKLWESNHAYTLLVKIGLGAWLAGKLGVLPAKYAKLGIEIGKGAAIAALLLPGSGPSSTASNFASAPLINRYNQGGNY